MNSNRIRPNAWSPEEIEFLRARYGTASIHDLADMLSRTFYAVNNKIHSLGLTHQRKVSINHRGQKVSRSAGTPLYWSRQMEDDLTRLFPVTRNEDLVEHFGMSMRTISRKAAQLGLRKHPDYIHHMSRSNLKKARLATLLHHNSGCIRKGQHLSPDTEFGGIRSNSKYKSNLTTNPQ